MTELDKARHLLQTRPISLEDISTRLGIPIHFLKEASANSATLERASWQRIHKMAELDNMFFMQKNLTGQSKAFTVELHDYLSKNEKNPRWQAVSREIKKIIVDDPAAVARCYRAYKEI